MREVFPQFVEWQNAMRPEDNGMRDGIAGIPGEASPASLFERKVQDALVTRLTFLRTTFQEAETRLWSQYESIRPAYAAAKRAYEQISTRDSYPQQASLSDACLAGGMAILGVTAASASIVALWSRGPLLACVVGIAGALALGIFSFVCGFTYQRFKSIGVRAATLSMFALVSVGILASLSDPNVITSTSVPPLMLAWTVVVAFWSIAAIAFYLYDPPRLAMRSTAEFMALLAKMTQVVSDRDRNRAHHIELAIRHAGFARQMIDIYRQNNLQARPSECPIPAYFSQAPSLPVSGPEDFSHRGDNAL